MPSRWGDSGGEARGRELIFLMTLPEGYKETSLPGDWRPAAPQEQSLNIKLTAPLFKDLFM